MIYLVDIVLRWMVMMMLPLFCGWSEYEEGGGYEANDAGCYLWLRLPNEDGPRYSDPFKVLHSFYQDLCLLYVF